MKKYLIPALLLILCFTMVLSSCAKNSVKEPEILKNELAEAGFTVFLYSPTDTAKYNSMGNLFGLTDTSGVTNILIADNEGDGTNEPRPLIIFYCQDLETTERVFESAKKSLSEIARFISMPSEDDCNLIKLDNTVMVGHGEMIERARTLF